MAPRQNMATSGIAAFNRYNPADVGQPLDDLLDENVLGLPAALLDLLPIGVYVCDRDGTIVRFNRCAAELWGRSPELGDLVDRFCGAYRLYSLEGRPIAHAACPMADVLVTGIPVRNQEIGIERPDGSRIVALVHIDPLRDDSGDIVGAVNCFRDITDHPRREGKSRDQERHSHELLEGLPVAVYTTDAAGRITFYNQAAVDLWDRRPVLGKEEWCGSWRLYWPDGTPMAHDECPMAVTLKEGRPIRGTEAIAQRPDGSRVPFIAYPTPLFNESGKLIGAMNALVDITEHKRAAEAAQRLSSIVESSHDAIISKNLDGIIISWNKGAERLFGYAPEEIIGKPVALLIPADRENEEPTILDRIHHGKRVDHYETIRRRKDGSLVEISLTVSPVKDAQGNIVGASKIARDITERRRAQEQQSLLIREMNHRVKNLFTLASGIVTLSARAAQTPKDLAVAVRGRLGALSRAHDLTLPDLVAPDDQAEKTATLDALVRAIVSPYENQEQAGGLRVSLSGPDVAIRGPAVTSLALLLNEFAANAAKYGAFSLPDGEVAVDWKIEAGELRLIWAEQGGPTLNGEARNEGFGSFLSRATVEGQFGGRIDRDWRPEGLTIHLAVPLRRLG